MTLQHGHLHIINHSHFKKQRIYVYLSDLTREKKGCKLHPSNALFPSCFLHLPLRRACSAHKGRTCSSISGGKPQETIRELWGDDLDTIGFADSTAQHAVSIGENYDVLYQDVYGYVLSSYVLNRTPKDSLHPDTARVYEFPEKIIRGDFNADGKSDFLCWNAAAKKITVLYGTDTINKFDTALVLQGDASLYEFGGCSFAVAKFNSTQYDGFVIADGYSDSLGQRGRLLYYQGEPG